MSRTNLEKIIDEFKLFSGPEQKNMFFEDKIENLRKRVNVQIMSDRKKGTDAFSISFQGEEPQKVMNIANALANYFIDENLKFREAQAIGTSSFLEDEMNAMRKQLENVENRLRKYKETHMGELPEQIETNLRVLERLQENLTIKQANLSDAKNRLILVENRISTLLTPKTEGSAPIDPFGETSDSILCGQMALPK